MGCIISYLLCHVLMNHVDVKMSHVIFCFFFQKVVCRKIIGFCGNVCHSILRQCVEKLRDKESRVGLSHGRFLPM